MGIKVLLILPVKPENKWRKIMGITQIMVADCNKAVLELANKETIK